MFRALVTTGISRAQALQTVVVGWLMNPIIINISTRGSGDSLPALFNIISFHAAVTSSSSISRNHTLVMVGALSQGIAIHLKIYPVIYLPAYFLYFGMVSIHTPKSLHEFLNSFSWTPVMPQRRFFKN
jgi:hypothetical protein